MATKIFGCTLFKQSQIKPDTVLSYLLALKSYHIHWQISLRYFNDSRMALIIIRRRRLFFNTKRNRFQITKDILKKITDNKLLSVIDFRINIAFNITWAEFMKMRELTYIAVKVKKTMFIKTGLSKSDISFDKVDQYAILCLKCSKTNMEYIGVQFILAATNKRPYSVVALRKHFVQDLLPPNRLCLQTSIFRTLPPKYYKYFETTNCYSRSSQIQLLWS